MRSGANTMTGLTAPVTVLAARRSLKVHVCLRGPPHDAGIVHRRAEIGERGRRERELVVGERLARRTRRARPAARRPSATPASDSARPPAGSTAGSFAARRRRAPVRHATRRSLLASPRARAAPISVAVSLVDGATLRAQHRHAHRTRPSRRARTRLRARVRRRSVASARSSSFMRQRLTERGVEIARAQTFEVDGDIAVPRGLDRVDHLIAHRSSASRSASGTSTRARSR